MSNGLCCCPRAKGSARRSDCVEQRSRSRAVEYAWLCSLCCQDLTVHIDDEHKICVVRGAGVDHREDDDDTQAAACKLAERELSCFVSAVRKLHGQEQATLSAQDWIDEFELIGNAALSTEQKCRAVTIAASARLASRLSIPGTSQEFRNFRLRFYQPQPFTHRTSISATNKSPRSVFIIASYRWCSGQFSFK